MALEISREKQPERRLTVSMYQVKDRLYETADGDIVEEGHADAAFLFATPGDEIPLEQAEERGLLKGKRPGRNKQRKAAANKQRKAAANKQRKAAANKADEPAVEDAPAEEPAAEDE